MSEFTYYPTFEFYLTGNKPESEKCSICQFEFEDVQNPEEELENHN